MTLTGKHVLVGVGGSIAAYRACDLVRRLRELGASVRVAPTKAACAFVTPLTFEALSGMRVLGAVLELDDGIIPHVQEAYRADLAIVAPASADLMAKMAHGFADEGLTATLLSYRGPLIVCPAMETRMWEHAATQTSVEVLQQRGAVLVSPTQGALASGRSGCGRLAEVADIVEAAVHALTAKDLVGLTLLVTAGPTVEDLDPARFLSNRSSGKMGIALAQAAARRGAHVHLVHGPVQVPLPRGAGIVTHAVRSAQQMHAKVHAVVAGCDVAVMCAAVADMRPKTVAHQKLKKPHGSARADAQHSLHTIELTENPDILKSLGALKRPPLCVGFAAETQDVERYAADKLKRKRCDLICANDISAAGSGFDGDTNRIYLARRDGSAKWLPQGSKADVAGHILDEVAALVRTRKRTAVKKP